jgi:hypothetical protein
MDTLEKAQGRWDNYTQREALICSQVLTTILEGLAMELQALKTGKEMWDALCKRNEDKAMVVTINIRSRIYALKCQDNANVTTHLHTLNMMREQLQLMGDPIDNRTYTSLVEALSIQHQENTKSADPRKVIQTIQESFDRSQFEEAQMKATENAMLAKGGKGRGNQRRNTLRVLMLQEIPRLNSGIVERRDTERPSVPSQRRT